MQKRNFIAILLMVLLNISVFSQGNINTMFYNLLNEFGGKSGHPVLLNTSFNGKDQPIVCDPKQAIEILSIFSNN